MRSGSTLLKSLLATQNEISDLPEINFQKYQSFSQWRLSRLSPEPIIVLKKPSWLGEDIYPKLPSARPRKLIILIRRPQAVIRSCQAMYRELSPDKEKPSREEFLSYWCKTYERLQSFSQDDCFHIRYEDLLNQPIKKTSEIFSFVGLEGRDGVDSYHRPADRDWKWYDDDGGDRIQSLKVQATPSEMIDPDLDHLVSHSERAQKLLKAFGYI